MALILSAHGIAKQFGGVKALVDVDFDLEAGEVHALFGSNGAGKSTLARIICGHYRADAGTITLAGERVDFKLPKESIAAGISIVTQETNMVPDLSAMENVILPLYGQKASIDTRALRQAIVDTLDGLGLIDAIPLDEPVRRLTAARRQMLEIARALTLNSRIVIFDEPTTALSPGEVARLFEAIDRLRKAGKGIVFVSHRLEELFAITDRITVLRDGRTAASGRKTDGLNQADLIRLMVGRDVAPIKRQTAAAAFDDAPTVLKAEHLNDGDLVKDVSFSLRRGEVLGLGGLVGAGRSEILAAIFGSGRLVSGSIVYRDRPFRASKPLDGIRAGIGYVAEDRRRESIVPDLSVLENLTLTDMARQRGCWVDQHRRRAEIERLADRMDLKKERLGDASLLNFSGGMQQKVLMMRCMILKPDVLLLDEPTKGVDVAARGEIYGLLRSVVREDGVSILLVSSDFEELLALSDSIVPISDGRSFGRIPSHLLDEEKLTLFAAPRSSAAGQTLVLNTAASEFGGSAFWVIKGKDSFICLLTSEDADRRLGFGVGAILANDASPTATAIAGGDDTALDGRLLTFRLANPHGRDLGTAGFLFEGAAPSAEALRQRLSGLLALQFGLQIRIAS